MPWIRTIRLLPGFWVAFNENDFHEIRFQALGFTEQQATDRCLAKFDKEHP